MGPDGLLFDQHLQPYLSLAHSTGDRGVAPTKTVSSPATATAIPIRFNRLFSSAGSALLGYAVLEILQNKKGNCRLGYNLSTALLEQVLFVGGRGVALLFTEPAALF
jgi:hypothetical protein